jgi:hypothetical protein
VKRAALDLKTQVVDGLQVPVVLFYVAELDIVFVAIVAHHWLSHSVQGSLQWRPN